MDTQVCKKCGIEKPLICFYKHKEMASGYLSQCVDCKKKYATNYRIENYDKVLKYQREKNSRPSTKLRLRNWSKKYQTENKEKCNERKERWRKENPEKSRAINKRSNDKILKTTKGKLHRVFSCAIRRSIYGAKNGEHWEHLVGYTIDELKTHLEQQFVLGMTWENYGQWHIDHIIPISVFNFNTYNDIDFKKCWALKNLRPLWAKENIIKSNKLNHPFQPSLCISF
jgi:hypothetical protein